MTRTPAALAAVVLLATSAACGIPADDKPRDLPEEQVPEADSGGADITADGQTLIADLFFTHFDGDRDKLVPVEREVLAVGSSSTPTPATVLEALLAGVQSTDEGAGDIVTKIPADTALSGQPELVDGLLTVHLNPAISGVTGDGARLAYGQMVCTADALEGVERVVFTVDGERVNPPTGEGPTASRPLMCVDYDSLRETPQG